MSTFKNTVDTVGDEALTNSIIDRSVTEICDEYIVGIGPYAFANCSSLKKADFLSCLSIGEGAFANCSALESLILRAETVCAASASMFDGSKIAAGTSYVYVPAALVDAYKADSVWSAFAAQIRAIEDYPEVCDPYTWESVFINIEKGTYASVYKIGDTVPLDLGTEGVVNMEIVAFDADDLADGSGKAPITWVANGILASTHRMNPALVTNDDGTYQEGTGAIGGWEKSEMRSYLRGTIRALIPATVRNAIKEVTKTQDSMDNAGTLQYNTTCIDDVWIPSKAEVSSWVSNITLENEQYWSRTAASSSKTSFVRGYGNKISYSASADTTNGVKLCFCT